jgi:hypothetical protein
LLNAGIELVVANGEVRPTWPLEVRSQTKWVWKPGADVFTLRAAGLSVADSELVAITEDHCTPGLSWCSKIVATYLAQPDCLVIGGAIANGSDNTILGRANFITIFSQYLATSLIARPCNFQYGHKRSALPRASRLDGSKWNFFRRLRAIPVQFDFLPTSS